MRAESFSAVVVKSSYETRDVMLENAATFDFTVATSASSLRKRTIRDVFYSLRGAISGRYSVG